MLFSDSMIMTLHELQCDILICDFQHIAASLYDVRHPLQENDSVI